MKKIGNVRIVFCEPQLRYPSFRIFGKNWKERKKAFFGKKLERNFLEKNNFWKERKKAFIRAMNRVKFQ